MKFEYATPQNFWICFLTWVGVFFCLSACAGYSTLTPTPLGNILTVEPTPTQPNLRPNETDTRFQPQITQTKRVPNTPFLSPTPSITPTPLHPLTIAWLQQQDFLPSTITVETTLAKGANYDRYLVSYQSDGLKIFALLTIPWGEKPENGWPVIIFNHGYIPPEIYRTTERYIAYVDAFATNGYIVFRSDYRGHDQSEGEARGAYGDPDYVIDVLNALVAIQNFPDADPQRVGMWGHSMGGYITLRAMVVNPDIKAGVIWAGVVGSYPNLFNRDFNTPVPNPTATPNGRRAWRNELIEMYGSPEENPEFWASLSANSFLDEISGPLQLHHGTGDTSVPFRVSELLYEQMQMMGLSVSFYRYEADDHNLSFNFALAMQRSIQFFDTYVKNAILP